MASTFTKLYLLNRAAPYTPATYRGTWTDTTRGVTKALDPSKAGGGVNAIAGGSYNDTTTGNTIVLYRGVSGPLAAQTFGGTVDVVIGVSESSGASNFAYDIHIYCTQGDSDTPRGDLLTNYIEGSGVNEWHVSGSPGADGRPLNAAQTLAALTISAGDRMVVEIGYKHHTAGSSIGQLFYGTKDSQQSDLSDLTSGSTSVTTLAGFLSFSAAITEGAYNERISQVVTESIATPTPNLRVSQVVTESIAVPTPNLRVSQAVVETVTTATATVSLRVSQVVVESVTPSPATATVKHRKTLSGLGTRIGSRQVHW